MPVFNQYCYEPLGTEDALRLISLDPAVDEGDPLSCTISQCRRSAQREKYSAVSYTWGEQNPSRTLEIRCDDDISYVRITSNVDALLRRFRARNKPRHLWIDAVCLDQTNGKEKTQQIPLMGRIYGEAKDVCIWLGEEDRMTAKVFTLLRTLSQLPEIQPQWDMAGRVAFHFKEVFSCDDALVGLRFLGDFFLRSWFSRRWVVQEAVLAREATFHCGRYSIPLLSVSWAATRFQSLDLASYPINMATNLREPTTNRGMLELLWYFHEAECSDPKDRIAALLGLVPHGNRFHLDYTAHWKELYRQVASLAFGLNDSAATFQLLIHLFEFGPVSHPEDASYPSWVPNWSKSRKRTLPFFSHIRNPDTHERYPTLSQWRENLTFTSNRGVLRVHWHPSIGGQRGCRVNYAKKYHTFLLDDNCRAERVIAVLDELFPSTLDCTQHIFALSSLLAKIKKFRHSSRDREINSAYFNEYIIKISPGISESTGTDSLRSLQYLDSILQEFCLFQLEPLEPCAKTHPYRVYGIGPKTTEVDDVMIPLWGLPWRHDEQKASWREMGWDFRLTTMLAVKYVGEPFLQNESNTSNERMSVHKGKVIGPAVCVISEGGRNCTLDKPINNRKEFASETDQWHSMRLT